MKSSLPRIPYFETTRYRVETIVELAKIAPGEKVADLGTGDGRIAIALAKKGAIVTAYEVEEAYVHRAKLEIEKENLIRAIEVKQKNFWDESLAEFSVITIYPMPDIMGTLEEKLKKELKKGARVLTNYYEFPNVASRQNKNGIYLYTF